MHHLIFLYSIEAANSSEFSIEFQVLLEPVLRIQLEQDTIPDIVVKDLLRFLVEHKTFLFVVKILLSKMAAT